MPIKKEYQTDEYRLICENFGTQSDVKRKVEVIPRNIRFCTTLTFRLFWDGSVELETDTDEGGDLSSFGFDSLQSLEVVLGLLKTGQCPIKPKHPLRDKVSSVRARRESNPRPSD